MRTNQLYAVLLGLFAASWGASANPIPTHHRQGELHAFLVVRSDDGKLIGTGEEVNTPVGRAWRARLTLHFRDGSLDDETAIYTQGSTLHLLSDHHVQRGKAFPRPLNMNIEMGTGTVTWHEAKDGKDQVRSEHMDLPADLGNGIMPLVLQNLSAGVEGSRVGYIVAMPQPRLVTLAMHLDGQENFSFGGVAAHAQRDRIHVEIGGLQGVLAPLVGKAPPDFSAWISTGPAPTLLKLRGFLYVGGPMQLIELSSPTWSR